MLADGSLGGTRGWSDAVTNESLREAAGTDGAATGDRRVAARYGRSMREEVGPPLLLSDGTPVPRRLLRMSAVTSPGPGGQHVNRSNTAVELRVPVAELPLSVEQLALLHKRLGGRITRSGELRVEASDHRSQWRNRRTAEQRLIALIDGALMTTAQRAPTRPSRAALARRRADRERAQATRAQRRPPPRDE